MEVWTSLRASDGALRWVFIASDVDYLYFEGLGLLYPHVCLIVD